MKTRYFSAIMILLLVSITLVLPPAHGILGSVLFMKSNSTAKIYADFTVRALNNETWDVGPPQIFTYIHDSSTNSPDLTIVADPNSITGNNPNTNVTYTITANSHAKGIYALFLYYCGLTPLVVGENESQVSPSTLRDFFTAAYSCPSLTEETPDMNIVGHSGITSKNIIVNDNNTITVMPQNTTNPNNFQQPPPPPYPFIANQTGQIPPTSPALQIPVYSSPLEQYKTGTATNNVKCNFGLQLVIKSEDGSPACVKPDTANVLIERGWAKITVTIANLDVIESNMTQTSKESIRIIPEYPISTGINKNGTITDSEIIEILFDNFKQTNSPLVIQILNPHGEIYKVDNIPHNGIQSDGFYKYQIYIKGNQSAMGQYKVIVTHDNATASISTYLSDAVP